MTVASSSTQVLYINATIITVNKFRDVVLQGSILIEGNIIKAIGKFEQLKASLVDEVQVVDLRDSIIIPGLINTHAHLAQSLLRGLAEDLPLHSWLCDAIWPLEAAYATDDGYVAARLTIAEMLLSGTTCFLEAMCTHTSNIDNIVKAVGEAGIRACVGKLIKATETNAVTKMRDARDKDVASMSVAAAVNAHQQHNGAFNERLHVWLAAGTPRGSPMAAHTAIGSAAKEHDIGITMHCAEAPADLTIYREQYEGRSPLQFCQEALLTSPRTVLAHVVHPDPTVDYKILQQTGTTVSHNPSSNCKLGSGIAPIPDMLDAGVNVALGTDGGPCNNTYDMFREMHLAAILHSGARQQAGIIDAYTVLEMATINGARALGLEHCLGSLEVGKKADFVAIRTSALAASPWDPETLAKHNDIDGGGPMDPVTVAVHACTGADVDLVVVDGQILVKDGMLIGMDIPVIRSEARRAASGIRQRSKIGARTHLGLNYI